MRDENPKFQAKLKAINWLYATLYQEEFLPRMSFKKFREENMYFLDGLSISSQMKEYNRYYFYLICMSVKLPITKEEIRYYFNTKGL
jgi:hypothetical protein